jgi:hypothetical protein
MSEVRKSVETQKVDAILIWTSRREARGKEECRNLK